MGRILDELNADECRYGGREPIVEMAPRAPRRAPATVSIPARSLSRPIIIGTTSSAALPAVRFRYGPMTCHRR